MSDLARRAVACKGWRWLPGMRAVGDLSAYGGRVCGIIGGCIELALDDRESDGEGIEWHSQARSSIGWIQVAGEMRCNSLPDLTDPATIGCILALAREAWQAPALQVSPARVADGSVREWFCYVNTSDNKYADPYFMGATEAEALIAALEAAP